MTLGQAVKFFMSMIVERLYRFLIGEPVATARIINKTLEIPFRYGGKVSTVLIPLTGDMNDDSSAILTFTKRSLETKVRHLASAPLLITPRNLGTTAVTISHNGKVARFVGDTVINLPS